MGRRGKNFWFVCCNNPQGVKVDLSTWPRYLSIQLRSAQGKHRRGKENTSGKPPSVLGTFKFPPRIPGNRERAANLMRAAPPKEALAKGQRELGVPRPTTHALSTPPGSTSPPHGRPPPSPAYTFLPCLQDATRSQFAPHLTRCSFSSLLGWFHLILSTLKGGRPPVRSWIFLLTS